MASTAYYSWLANGSPYRLCRPAAALQRIFRRRGFTVYDYPDGSHLKATKPEDHTPFAVTGWPVRSAYGVAHAVDIMPRADTAAARAENAAIARKLIAARNAGVPGVMWIKYLNWTDERGICRQERWMPGHETRTSTDRGHIHISARSDCDNDDRADHYDPLGEDMALSDTVPGTGSSGTGGKDRTVGQILGDQANLRAVLIGEKTPAQAGYAAGTPLAQLLALAAAGPAAPVDLPALATALTALLAPLLDAELDASAILGVLESPEGQAALVAAANTAEDS
jgi:hypothetical protein